MRALADSFALPMVRRLMIMLALRYWKSKGADLRHVEGSEIETPKVSRDGSGGSVTSPADLEESNTIGAEAETRPKTDFGEI